MEAFLKSTFGRIATRLAAAAMAGLVAWALQVGIVIEPDAAEAIRAGVEAIILTASIGTYGLIHRLIKGKTEAPDG